MSVITQGLKGTALLIQGYGVAGLSALREPLTVVRRTGLLVGGHSCPTRVRLVGERGSGTRSAGPGAGPIHATRSDARFGAR